MSGSPTRSWWTAPPTIAIRSPVAHGVIGQPARYANAGRGLQVAGESITRLACGSSGRHGSNFRLRRRANDGSLDPVVIAHVLVRRIYPRRDDGPVFSPRTDAAGHLGRVDRVANDTRGVCARRSSTLDPLFTRADSARLRARTTDVARTASLGPFDLVADVDGAPALRANARKFRCDYHDSRSFLLPAFIAGSMVRNRH